MGYWDIVPEGLRDDYAICESVLWTSIIFEPFDCTCTWVGFAGHNITFVIINADVLFSHFLLVA